MTRVPIIGLFSGAGGLEIGATLAGGDVRLSVELDRIACETLRLNPTFHSGNVLEGDVSKLDGRSLRKLAGLSRRDACILVGGPPCQPFSKSSYWTDSGADSRYRRARSRGESSIPKPPQVTEARPDDRRSLVQEYLRLIVESDAQGFLFENVTSISHPRNKIVLDQFIEEAQNAKFQTVLLKANAADYGVPQKRHRIVVLGLRGAKPLLPTATHSENATGDLFNLPYVTVGEALADLSSDQYFESGEVVTGRYAKELLAVPPGQNYKALSAWAGHPNPVFEAETRFWNFLLKLDPNLPSWTIQATPGPWVGPFHWESRRLRTVELAALQTFPREYTFAGTRRDKIRQIGNAVPALMAQRIIEPLVSTLMGGSSSHSRKSSRKRVPCDT